MSTNPYAAPKSAVADEPSPQGEYVPGGKTVPASNGWNWIADGWALFKEAPGIWILIIFVFALMWLVAFVPVVGSIALTLLMPVFVGGIMSGCQSLEEGNGLRFDHLFEGFRTRFGTLVAVGALSLAASIATVAIGVLIALVLGTGVGVLGAMATGSVETSPAMALALVLVVLIGLALTIPIAAAVWFAPALVVLQNLGAIEALKASFTGCLRNMVPFLIYGIVLLIPAIVATVPAALGWLVLGPIVAGSVYTSYRDIYLR
jgi:uncharacterized membrane protein